MTISYETKFSTTVATQELKVVPPTYQPTISTSNTHLAQHHQSNSWPFSLRERQWGPGRRGGSVRGGRGGSSPGRGMSCLPRSNAGRVGGFKVRSLWFYAQYGENIAIKKHDLGRTNPDQGNF